MIALIFASGQSGLPDTINHLGEQADIIIAADGGANYCFDIGMVPHIITGDLDSIKSEILEEYKAKGVIIKQHPVKKDAMDLELAIDLAMGKGATVIWLVGALGGRWDMSLANILLTASSKYKDMLISLHDDSCIIRLHHPGTLYSFIGSAKSRVSFLPLKSDVVGVTLSGFAYPLTEHTINFGSTLGVSNIIVSDKATVLHSDGVLLSIQSFSK